MDRVTKAELRYDPSGPNRWRPAKLSAEDGEVLAAGPRVALPGPNVPDNARPAEQVASGHRPNGYLPRRQGARPTADMLAEASGSIANIDHSMAGRSLPRRYACDSGSVPLARVVSLPPCAPCLMGCTQRTGEDERRRPRPLGGVGAQVVIARSPCSRSRRANPPGWARSRRRELLVG